MFLVSLDEGRIIDDTELKAKLATERPYADWLRVNLLPIEDVPPVEPPAGDWTHHDRFDEEFLAAAREFTQRMADQLAEGISMHPTHWHMLQPVFLADLEPR